MHLEYLSLSQFRCLSQAQWDLPPGRVLVVGDNASGKTTLLEAVFYLVTVKITNWESVLGTDTIGVIRPNANSCP